MTGSDPKLSARELLEEAHPALVGLSHWIHANPETGFQETLASGWVAEWLVTGGFEVETGVAGMPTAVVGRTGPGPLHVAICVEYDALPEVGHACGHNVIAAASVGAGLALASVAEGLGLRVTVLGTPAEETGGGKLRLIDAGAFDGVHAAMMVHPWPTDVAMPSIIAVNQLEVTYTGREAHAAGFPQRGLNAADALVLAQTAIGLLRQQLLPTDRVHGIVTRGGDAPNIIPAHTTALYMVRAHDRARMDELTKLVTRCFEAGALATGTEVTVVEGTAYGNMVHDADLAALYRHNAELLGRVFDDSTGSPVSTDMGNVSHVVPSIHPMIGIAADGAVNHQAAFADACATPSADQAILDGAIAMSWTVIDAAQNEVLRGRLIAEGLAREALALAVEAEVLEEEAAVLAEAAAQFAEVDPDAAEELALTAIVLDAQAQDLADEAVERLDAAIAIQGDALLEEVAGEMASDAEDLQAQAAEILESSDELVDGAATALAAAEALESEAAELEQQAEAIADTDPETAASLATVALELEAQAEELKDEAEIDAADAADLSRTAFVFAAADVADQVDILAHVDPASLQPATDNELADEPAGGLDAADSSAAPESLTEEAEDEAATQATGAWLFASASDAALDDVADEATVAVEATEAATEMRAAAEALIDEAEELTDESAELSVRSDALTDEALAVAESDPNTAEELAAGAFEFEARAEATAVAAEATFELALEVEADAQAADDLAEVATEAAEDAEAEAIVAVAFAEEAIETDDLAEVVVEAAEDAEAEAVAEADEPTAVTGAQVVAEGDVAEVDVAEASAADAALGNQHAEWEQQFLAINAHATWEDEYARMLDDTGAGSDGPDAVATSGGATDAWSQPEPEPKPEPEPEPEESTESTWATESAWATEPATSAEPSDSTEDAWYSGGLETKAEAAVAEEPVADEPEAEAAVAEEPVADETEAEAAVAEEPVAEEPDAADPAEEATPETPLSDFQWIPAAPVEEA